MAKRVVFHIGLAKTGTTSFQHACHRHRRMLAHHGVLYPRSLEGLSRNHSPLAASYLAHRPRDRTIAVRVVPRAVAVARLRTEIDASPCHVALVSSEHLSIHFDAYEADQLVEDFAAYEPIVVVALREPYGRFLSLWNTHVTAGGRLSLEDFGRSILVPDNRFLSIRETLLIWRGAFGANRVHIIDYDRVGDVAAAILRHCGVEMGFKSGRRRRASLPLAAVAALRAVNTAIVGRQVAPRDDVAAWAQRSAFSILARRRLAVLPADETPPIVSARTLAALDLIYENDRAWLAETYGFALASTRARYVVGEPPATSVAEALLADALFREVSRGLWTPSKAFAALYRWIEARRARGH